MQQRGTLCAATGAATLTAARSHLSPQAKCNDGERSRSSACNGKAGLVEARYHAPHATAAAGSAAIAATAPTPSSIGGPQHRQHMWQQEGEGECRCEERLLAGCMAQGRCQCAGCSRWQPSRQATGAGGGTSCRRLTARSCSSTQRESGCSGFSTSATASTHGSCCSRRCHETRQQRIGQGCKGGLSQGAVT